MNAREYEDELVSIIMQAAELGMLPPYRMYCGAKRPTVLTNHGAACKFVRSLARESDEDSAHCWVMAGCLQPELGVAVGWLVRLRGIAGAIADGEGALRVMQSRAHIEQDSGVPVVLFSG